MKVVILNSDGRVVQGGDRSLVVPEGGELQLNVGGRILRVAVDLDGELLLQVAPSHGPIMTERSRGNPNRLRVSLGA